MSTSEASVTSTSAETTVIASNPESPPEIPPLLLLLLNNLYIGLNYFDRVATARQSLDLSYISQTLNGITIEEETSQASQDATSSSRLATLAAKYIQDVAERSRAKRDAEAEVARKLDLVNEMLTAKRQVLAAKRGVNVL